MGRSVTITTPIPTLEEVGKRLNMSKARQQRLIEIVRGSRNGHMGSSIDDFLRAEGIFEEAQAEAIKEVVAGQLAEAMKQQKISKNKMATLLKTSRKR
jgi:hypothetical protein